MPSLSLEDQLFVLQGDPINDYDFTKGRAVDIWIAPLTFNQSVPDIAVVSLNTAVAVNDVTVSVTTPVALTLYRNDVLNFGHTSGTRPLIVRSTTTIGASPVSVPIFAAPYTIATTISANPNKCLIYKSLLPFLSAKEGAFSAASASYAEGHNKNMGLYAVSQKIREDYTSTITGDLNYGDPCLDLLEDLKVSGLSKLFVQARYTVAFGVGGSYYGDGVLGEQYIGNVALSMSDTEAGMVSMSIEVKISGARKKYSLLVPTFP
jgi:hypothetical protein